LGIDFVARQVDPWPEDRENLRTLSGKDEIPALQTEDGRFVHGTRAIFAYLSDVEPWEHAAGHRRRFVDHRDAREADAPGQLLEYFHEGPGDETEVSPHDAEVVHVPEAKRYELRLGGKRVGEAA